MYDDTMNPPTGKYCSLAVMMSRWTLGVRITFASGRRQYVTWVSTLLEQCKIPAQSPPLLTVKYHRRTRVSINSILEVRTNVTKLKNQLLIKDLISSKLKYRATEARLIYFLEWFLGKLRASFKSQQVPKTSPQNMVFLTFCAGRRPTHLRP